MRTLEHNGENWYTDTRSIFRRVRDWVCSKPRHEWTPISFLGHRLTFYGWGGNMRVGSGYLVVTRPHGHSPDWRAYHSPDGTPGKETTWFIGAPREVRERAGDRVHPLSAAN